MPAPSTVSEFLDLVRKSGVVDEQKLDTGVEKLRAVQALPDDPGQLAALLVGDGLLTQFQAEQVLLGKWRRFTIGKYKVLERLGSGGTGSYYLCRHMGMGRCVAVKVLPAAWADDASSLERFYREARALAALYHPNVIRAYDIDQDETLHFLVMEYVDGSTLQQITEQNGVLDVLRASHYIRQATLGLQHAHEAAGLAHRNVKPRKLLVDRNGIVKIIGWGKARFCDDEGDNLPKKSDIYSLGGTLYFCLTGRTPFIRPLRPEVPEGLASIIERMMAKDPDRCYQTAQEVADALAPWTQTPIPPPPEAEMPQLSPAAREAIKAGDHA
jgi:serine/threonine protein kinase